MKHSIKTKLFSIASIGLVAGSVPFAFTSCGTTEKANFFEKGLDNLLKVGFCDKGAAAYSIKYKNKLITYHPKEQADFLNNGFYHGKVVGRVAGRIADGKFTMDGREYTGLDRNETSTTHEKGLKNNTLHGGSQGLSSQYWTYTTVDDDPNDYKITFSHTSKDGEAAFPGQVEIEIQYLISKTSPRMEINIKATPDRKTPIDITTHPYFRLPDSYTVLDHYLQIKGTATQIARFEETGRSETGAKYTNQIVIGRGDVNSDEFKVGDKAPFDFYTNPKRIGADIAEAKAFDPVSAGYDHIWYMGTPAGTAETQLNQIILSYNHTKLTVKTDADSVIIYANCYPHEGIAMNTDVADETDHLNGGLTIEPFTFFTKDQMNDGTAPIFHTPNNPYTRKIIYELETVEDPQ